nr:HEPN domain-containing protein [Sporosarcina sp. Marseille-Q4063]
MDRALRFILEAKGQSFLPAKITFYISALESLLSNSNSELRMQVADRGARILGQTFNERVRINEVISKAYTFRSTYIHGAARTERSIRKALKPLNNVEELLIELDAILRKIKKYSLQT